MRPRPHALPGPTGARRLGACLSAALVLALPLAPRSATADVTFTLGAGEDFVVENNTGTVEHLRIDEASGNISRSGALFVHSTPFTLAVGFDALAGEVATPFDSGDANTAFGHSALLTTSGGCCVYGQPYGGFNSAFGKDSLRSNVDGSGSSAFGASALRNNLASRNSAFGVDALRTNTTGWRNAAFGADALRNNTTAGYNSAFGAGALSANVDGAENAAFGADAMVLNDAGSQNAAFGARSLRQNNGDDNAAFGYRAMFANQTGANNAAFGHDSLSGSTTGNDNAAFGQRALFSNQSGSGNSAFGQDALSSSVTTSDNSAFGRAALASNDDGIVNAAFGAEALTANTNGTGNTAVGYRALASNTAGDNVTAVGLRALESNQDAIRNTAIGSRALQYTTTGGDNTALGMHALRFNSTGTKNTAVGSETLDSSQGARNTAVGAGALGSLGAGDDNIAIGGGDLLVSGSDNIYIGSTGPNIESGKIRIGNSAHTETFIDGISGNTASGGIAVYVNASNELGTLTSSARFKEKIRDLDDPTGVLMQLRPVSFVYREDEGGDGRTTEYGLIAEEVAEIAPELVAYDGDGVPYSVRYHLLTPMLLSELQRQQRTIAEQGDTIAELRERVRRLSTASPSATTPAEAAPR